MSGQEGSEKSGEAEVRRRRLSWVWLVPIASLAVGGWLAWNALARRGPLIDLTFETAEGLEAGQSQVKFKDVLMGTVESFDLTHDRKVVIHARMIAKAEPLLTEGAQFWVVKPRVFGGDITGLNTLVSGSYMEMSAGEEGKPRRTSFIGLEAPPAVDPSHPGREFELSASRIGPINVGTPVFYRDVEVGKVVRWKLVEGENRVTVTITVHEPYADRVHDDTRFWNSSGIGVTVGADGVQLQVDSVKAVLLGGVTFETPPPSDGDSPKVSEASHAFTLYPSRELAEAGTATNKSTMAVYLDSSAGGLSIGAPVMLLGFRVGTVTGVVLQYDTDTSRARVRAEFVVEIGRVKPVGSQAMPRFPDYWSKLVADGLRIHLKGGNLLTGQQQLSLEIDGDAQPARLTMEGGTVIMPVSQAGGGSLDELSAQASKLMAKVGQMPFEQIGNNLNATLAGAGAITNDPRLKQAVARLNETLAAAQELVRHVDAAATPALRRLPAMMAELDATLGELRSLTASVSAGSAGSGKFGRDLDRLLVQASDAVQSVRAVADLLSRHPEALIRGRVPAAAAQ